MLLPTILLAIVADVRGCVCDPERPETMGSRVCSLTLVAVREPGNDAVFFIKDTNPTKPNRWLAIPHSLHRTLSDMTPGERTGYWSAAIGKAHILWKDEWAIAVNGEEKRTQCQLHIHIGKLLTSADTSGGSLVDRIEDIPVPPPGTGIWIHPEAGKLRVHPGENSGELNLMR